MPKTLPACGLHLTVILTMCGLLTACTQQPQSGPADTGTRAITQMREAEPEDLKPVRRSLAERFGADSNPHQGMVGGGMGMAGSMTAGPQYLYDVPEGWTDAPASAMRPVNLLVAGNPQAECYLSALSGDGGGLLANVNRWRAQMELAPIDEAELAALPKTSLLGKDAVSVSLQGTFKGMGGDKNEAGFLLAGVLAVNSGQSYFLRMTGPSALIEAELPKFEQLRDSLEVSQEPAMSAAATMGGADAAHGAHEATFQWDVPAGWVQGPDKPMRLATFAAQDATCEFRLFALGGAAGGAEMNLNRWREQMAQPPLSGDEIAALPRWPVLGKEAVYIEIQGDYTGMSGETESDRTFLGLVCTLEGQTLFAIMVGPRDRMAHETENFAAFCKSLR